jgi:hypothetical protein
MAVTTTTANTGCCAIVVPAPPRVLEANAKFSYAKEAVGCFM